MVSRLAEWKAAMLAPLLRRSGQILNPEVLAAGAVANTFTAAATAVPVAFVLSLMVSPWLALLALAPVAAFVSPDLRVKDKIAQRREGVERELPFFSVLVNVLAGAGVPLYSIMRDLASSDTFVSMKREAQLVRRDVAILGMNPNEALERLASNHPSARFADFLLGYTSKARSGGDVALYLSGESGALLRGLEASWVRYVSRVGIIGSMMITAFGVVPLLLMVVGIFSPGYSIVGLVLFTGVGVPLVTVALLYMAGRMQPLREEPIVGGAAKSVIVALPGAAVGISLGGAWISVGVALFIFFVAYGLSVKEQIAETKAIEEGLTSFLKDLLEYKRQDYDLTRAVLATQAEVKYNPRFSRLLSRVASQLKLGVPLDEVRVECRSVMGRLTFQLLGQMSRSGGGSVDTVYQVSNFADRMMEMKSSASAEMKPYVILSYISPLLLAFGVAFMGGVLSSFSTTARPVIASLRASGVQVGPLPVPMAQVSDLLIVVSAASLGLISAKITDFTVRNTLKASANVALAVAAISASVLLGSHSLPHLP
jgi:archaellum biogenesis protein FlaJ (TadC family)